MRCHLQTSQPFVVGDHVLPLGASAGIAIAPMHGSDVDELLSNADLALYLAKKGGGRVYRYFTPSLRASAQSRRALARELHHAFANDEAEEGSSFQGTIPQALMMMNGELMQEALSGKQGSFLCEVIQQAGRTGRAPENQMIESLYLAALSRRPTAKELSQTRHYLEAFPDSLQVLQDLFWALLNSNEFILIH